jgi:protein SCO1/2
MSTKRLMLLLAVVMTVAVTVTMARTGFGKAAAPNAEIYNVTGVVTAPVGDGRVMVAHEEIPGYMPAMTMPFAVGADVPSTLAPGDRVRFVLRVTAESSQAEGFVVTGHDAAIAGALKAGRASAPRRLKKGDELPAFSLTTSASRPFTEADLRGHVTAVTFIFTRCPVPEFCPLMVKRFKELQRELNADTSLGSVRLLSVTLDPAFDTPQVLASYAAAMGADTNRWQFVTGRPEEIARLTSAFSIHVERNGVLLDHTLATAIVGRDGRVTEIWRGNAWTSAAVLDALRDVTRESAAVLSASKSISRQ